MIKDYDKHFMKLALKEAKKAYLLDEVPIGAIIVKDNKIISRGHNLKENKKDPTFHAEIVAIRKACKKLKSWRLNGCKLYVTIEPCIMCAGAIYQSRIGEVIFGSFDLKGGAFGSNINLLDIQNINHYPKIKSGIMEKECREIVKKYFKGKRKNEKNS